MELEKQREKLIRRLRELVQERRKFPRPARHFSLTPRQRASVLAKTDGRCHLCGGRISPEEKFAADHVLAHAAGGEHKIENYLAAHTLCNGTRWFYSPEEFRWILRMGNWARKQIEDETPIGRQMSTEFLKSENRVSERHRLGVLRAIDLFGKIDFDPSYDLKKERKR